MPILLRVAGCESPVDLGELLVCGEVFGDVGQLADGCQVDVSAGCAHLCHVPVGAGGDCHAGEGVGEVDGGACAGSDGDACGVVRLGSGLKREAVLGSGLDLGHVDAEGRSVFELGCSSGRAGHLAVSLHDHVDLGGGGDDQLVGVSLQPNGSGSGVAGTVGHLTCDRRRAQCESIGRVCCHCGCTAGDETGCDEGGCCVACSALLDG